MITANEACKLSKENRETTLEAELRQLEKVILKATATGKTETWFYDRVSEAAKEELEKNGFSVNILYTLRDGYSVKIAWGNGCN